VNDPFSKQRGIIYGDEFEDMLKRLGLPSDLDEIIRRDLQIMAAGPERFEIVYEPDNLRMMRLEPIRIRPEEPPCKLLIYFVIEDESNVEVRWIVKADIDK
jgi:hypothetical protein